MVSMALIKAPAGSSSRITVTRRPTTALGILLDQPTRMTDGMVGSPGDQPS
jgi:hypothetical protein